jgi:phospholipid-translocating ATPase
VVRYSDPATGEPKQEGVTINEMLLRGCALRNTPWVIALVVFTGADTKIMLNGGDTPSKRSKIEKETNFNVFVNFGILTIMCVIAAIANGVIDAERSSSAYFFEAGADPSRNNAINAIVTLLCASTY